MSRPDDYPTRLEEMVVSERSDPIVHGLKAALSTPPRHAELERYERDGFLFLPDLFHPAESAAMLAEAEQLNALAVRDSPPEAFFEQGAGQLRSLFAVHRSSECFRRICEDPRVTGLARAILGDDVYIHQTRLNFKPAFDGREFFWHSDFETWHAEDGMARMRAVSLSLALTPNYSTNGPLMLIPGSHTSFVGCAGRTPRDHYRQSLVQQRIGVPDERAITRFAKRRGIKAPTGGAGSAVIFDCNTLHGSAGNITPFPRTNLFVVYNAMSNQLTDPYCGNPPRPEYIGARIHTAMLPRS